MRDSVYLKNWIVLTALMTGTVAWAQAPAAEFSEPIVENYTVTAPGILPYGDIPLRFFFMRDAQVWNGETVVDLAKLKWPTWDKNQVPYSIVPVMGQKTFITLYNDKREVIETQQLKKNFSIESYNQTSAQPAAFYQFSGLLERERISYRGQLLAYKGPKKILSCEGSEADPESSSERKKIEACLESFKSYIQNSQDLKRQLFVRVSWPKVSDRSLRMSFQTNDRQLSREMRQAGHVYLSDRNKKRFSAELGLTENENLNIENMDLKSLPAFEKASVAPDGTEVQQMIHEISMPDGSGLQFFAHSNDRVKVRTFENVRVGQSQINLQIVKSATTDIKIEKNQNFEKRTGLAGALRKWQILGFGGWNQLVSSRGDSDQLTGLPGVSARYNLGVYDLYPYISYENTVLKAQSGLSISELMVGAEQKQPWFENLSLSFGYHHYSLSGKNTGAARLGGIEAGSLGASFTQRFEDYMTRQKATVMIGNTYSYGIRAEFGKLFDFGGSDTLFVGPFLSYTVYRGHVLNRLNVRETFSENRTQIGLMIGIVGADSK